MTSLFSLDRWELVSCCSRSSSTTTSSRCQSKNCPSRCLTVHRGVELRDGRQRLVHLGQLFERAEGGKLRDKLRVGLRLRRVLMLQLRHEQVQNAFLSSDFAADCSTTCRSSLMKPIRCR